MKGGEVKGGNGSPVEGDGLPPERWYLERGRVPTYVKGMDWAERAKNLEKLLHTSRVRALGGNPFWRGVRDYVEGIFIMTKETPPLNQEHPVVAAFRATILKALSEREEALRVPFLGDDLSAPLGVSDVPSWFPASRFREMLEALETRGEIESVPLSEMETMEGLPLRKYWGSARNGWRVVRSPADNVDTEQ